MAVVGAHAGGEKRDPEGQTKGQKMSFHETKTLNGVHLFTSCKNSNYGLSLDGLEGRVGGDDINDDFR